MNELIAKHAHLVRGTTAVLLAGMLTACANWPPEINGRSEGAPRAGVDGRCDGEKLTPADKTRLSGIEQLITEGKPYAALAQLDALGSHAVEARIVQADALRRIDRDADAKALYEAMLGSCLDGRAQHGLGLIAARSGQHATSLSHLQKARATLPTDARIRNDLGYALLLAGQTDAAQFELLTALDLRPNDPLVSRNLVLLRFKQGAPEQALELARQFALDDATTQRLQQQAAALPHSPIELPAPAAPPMPAASTSS